MRASNEWAHTTLESAIEHATALARGSGDDQIVVQIVRYVGPVLPAVRVQRVR